MRRIRARMSTGSTLLDLAVESFVLLGQAQTSNRSTIESGDKPGARGVHVAVPAALLLVREEALRQDQVQVILCARHCDIEKTTLFLNLRGVACAEIRRDAAVDRV
jgi:hypothetical protein